MPTTSKNPASEGGADLLAGAIGTDLKDKKSSRQARWAERNPLATWAHAATRSAIRRGLLAVPSHCERCGEGGRITAAQKAGLAITPSLTAEIDKLASGYASATAEAERLDEAQRDVQQRAEEMRAFGKDVFGGFIRDVIQGKKASDALADSLDKVADKLLDIALNSAFDSKGGGFLSGLFGGGGSSDPWAGMRNVGKPSGGLLGGWLIPGFLKDGGEVRDGPKGVVRGAGGPRGDKIATMLSDGEFVVNSAATRKHRAMLEAINRGGLQFRANGGAVGYSLPAMEAPTMPDLRGVYLPKMGGSGRNEVVRVELQADPSLMVKVAQQEIRTAAGPIVQVAVMQADKRSGQAFMGRFHSAQSRNYAR